MSGEIPTKNGEPEITSNMKYSCIGEFFVEITLPCPKCYNDSDNDEKEDCEICGGNGDYIQDIPIPWITMKQIYKMMATEAMKDIK